MRQTDRHTMTQEQHGEIESLDLSDLEFPGSQL